MGVIDFFTKKDTADEEIKKIINDLNDVQNTIIEFTNNTELDKDIADMIGQLKAQDPEKIKGEKLIEFLVYLSDKTKTKTDSIQSHYSDTMRRVIHAKIDMLIMYHSAISKRNVIMQILSFRAIMPLVIAVIVIIATILLVHKYDRELFVDIGLSSARHDGN